MVSLETNAGNPDNNSVFSVNKKELNHRLNQAILLLLKVGVPAAIVAKILL